MYSGYFANYHCASERESYDAGHTLQLSDADCTRLQLDTASITSPECMRKSVHTIEQMILEQRGHVYITSMQLGYADPDTALTFGGMQMLTPVVTHLSPRAWAEFPGSHVRQYADLQAQHAHSPVLKRVWHEWMLAHQRQSWAMGPNRVLIQPDFTGDYCRVHALDDRDVLYTPTPVAAMEAPPEQSHVVSVKFHAFEEGRGPYDAGRTLILPEHLRNALTSGDKPWDEENLHALAPHIHQTCKNVSDAIRRVTSMQLLDIATHSTQERWFGFKVRQSAIVKSSPMIWEKTDATTITHFDAKNPLHQRLLEHWRLVRGMKGDPVSIICIPQPNTTNFNAHPMAHEDLIVDISDNGK